MTHTFEQLLDRYAELIVKVGLNIQPGQRLLVGVSSLGGGAPLHAAPLVRCVTTRAYQAGARLVDVIWDDEELRLIRLQHAPRDSFTEINDWRPQAVVDAMQRGDAVLSISGNNPDLLREQDPELISAMQRTILARMMPASAYLMRNATNWLVVAAPVPGWAAKVFPDVLPEAREARLWDAIFDMVRVRSADPVAAWRSHVAELAARRDTLTGKRYQALRFTGPGTDLTVGLPAGHIWLGGAQQSENGITFVPNLPTEEIFTLPHRASTHGVVTASKPLAYAGNLIDGFRLTFAEGRVVDVAADQGEALLRKLVETDDGAGRLGEVALVPHNSPIAQSGRLFYNILIDENAASHIALGRAYKFSLAGGATLSDDEFAAAGGNQSLIHIDFMIGSGEVDVDGITTDGASEPVMRQGCWTFDVSP